MADEDGIAELESRLRRAEAALEETFTERNRLWHEVHRRAAVDEELEHYRSAVHQLHTSLSWRITRPLRTSRWFVRQSPELYRRLRRFVSARPRST
jgi:hypothetical protein